MSDDERLLEPGSSYEQYRRDFCDNASKLFNHFIEAKRIPVEASRAKAEEYRKWKEAARNQKSNLDWLKIARVLLWLFAIVAAITAIYGIEERRFWQSAIQLLLTVGCLVPIFHHLNPAVRRRSAEFREADESAKAAYRKAVSLIEPLFGCFDEFTAYELIHQTIPQWTFFRTYSPQLEEALNSYGLPNEDGPNTSTVNVISGDTNGSPFAFVRTKRQNWTTQQYTGSLEIEWTTETVVDPETGETEIEHHSQTLYAMVSKPCPYYSSDTKLYYANRAVPDLSFSRSPSGSSIRDFKRQVRHNEKKMIQGNEEFEALFGAFDRSDELQYRMLFTPLAQKNLSGVIKGDTSPFGNDFYFNRTKNGLNTIQSRHSEKWNMELSKDRFCPYDIDLVRQQFLELTEACFTSVYFDLAPIMSIPLYQRTNIPCPCSPDLRENVCSTREAEVLANRLGNELIHPNSETAAVFKTEFLSSDGCTDRIKVRAFSYGTISRTEFVSVMGEDGEEHDVPVTYDEYYPIEYESIMNIKLADKNEREQQPPSKQNGRLCFHSLIASLNDDSH